MVPCSVPSPQGLEFRRWAPAVLPIAPGTRAASSTTAISAAFRMDTFRNCGGYDETFTHNEDAEFDCRQTRLGGRVLSG
jgi:hypothetical protein